jgi:beta-glucosidase
MKKIEIAAFIAVLSLFCLPLGYSSVQPENKGGPQLGKASIKDVIAAMTLEEKASLVVGTRMRMSGAPPAASPVAPSAQTKAAVPTAPMTGQPLSLVPGAAGTTFAIPRLGISPMVLADGPAGLRISPTRENDKATYYCTAFPVATLLASTWDVDLVHSVGQAVGNELLEYGVDILLAPALNLHRNPLCGRNFEYYSEDPLLTGKMAAAMVNGVESQGVGTSLKHFVANNAETNRNSLDTIVSSRALREIYLEGFRIAVEEARPWTVMSSYNLINGVYTSESADLLTSILRKDWGFRGFVMTDWGGGRDPVAQMAAGNDLLMPGNPNQIQTIIKAVKDGRLDLRVLDRNVENILRVLVQSPRFKGYRFSNNPDLKAHALLARQAAAEGMVLLKNTNSALPLARDIKTIAAFGNTSYDIITGGTGSGHVNEAYSVSLVEGLRNAGYSVHEGLQTLYESYLKIIKEGRPRQTRGFAAGPRAITEMCVNKDLVDGVAGQADAAVITIGRNSGEGRDRTNEEGDFKLTSSERELIKLVSSSFQAKGKKAIVVLNIGGVIEVASWRDEPDAILLAWQAGQETGNSIADILSGKINPSGKLATTFPVVYEDVPSAKNFPGKVIEPETPGQDQRGGFGRSRPSAVTYEEGIYVGYRYYETFGVKPAYEFGYGLSYTNFTYANLRLSSAAFAGKLTATVEAKNSGNVAGKDIVELYLAAPIRKFDKPALELKGFAKTKQLAPDESQTLTFILDVRSLASFDEAGSSWVAEAGKYDVKIGASSRDIRQTASFMLGKNVTVKKESLALVPKEKINELMLPRLK